MSPTALAAIFSELGHDPLALIVDRDSDTRQMYAEFLRMAKCEIDEAEDGQDALAKAIARHPDIVVTEARLPGIDGYDLCRALHDDPATRDIPVLFVTADAFAADLQRAHDAGAAEILVKPCLPEKLAVAIKAMLMRSQGLRQRSPRAADSAIAYRRQSEESIQLPRKLRRRRKQ